EAGPTGFELARACLGAGIDCLVAAPGKIPRAAAERVKTDRRDAERLARLLRLGELTPVRVPDELEEATRDLVRAREDARSDLMRARHRLSKLLLRHGMVYDATAWTRAHDAWLRRQRFRSGPLAVVFDECYGRMLDAKARRDALDRAITELARARGPRQAPHDRGGRRRPRTRRTLLGARDDGVAATINGSARRAHRRNDARSDPREHCEQPHGDARRQRTAPLLTSHTRSCGTNP